MDNINNTNISISRFEKMLKENRVLFFDSLEFENIISYYLDSGRLTFAKKALSLSLNQYPTNTNLRLLEIEILIQEDKLEEAMYVVDSILLIEINNFEAIFLKSSILSKQKKYLKSISLLKDILSNCENKKDIFYQIGIEYLFLEKFEKANYYFQNSLKFDFQDHSTLYNILYCFEITKDIKNLIIFLEDYLSKNPYSEIGWYNIGKNYVKIKKYDKAIAAFDYSIFSDETFTSSYIDKGKLLEKMGEYEKAIKNYKEIISINTNSTYALFRIGLCYEKKQDFNNSISYYFKCIEDDPNMDKANYRISLYYYKKNNFKKATEFIEKAIRSNHEKSKYWRIYLNCLSKTSTKNY